MDEIEKEKIIQFTGKSFAVCRWAYGMRTIQEQDTELQLTIMFLKTKPCGKLRNFQNRRVLVGSHERRERIAQHNDFSLTANARKSA